MALLIVFGIILYVCVAGVIGGWFEGDSHSSGASRGHQRGCDAYGRLLEDPRWKAKRKRILERDNYRCTWCGRAENLQVHHKYYMRYPDGKMAEPWDYPDDKLVTLCDRCHREWHGKHKVKVYWRKWGVHF